MNDAVLTDEQIRSARAARAAYAREYRRKNPQKNREAILRYWAKRAARTDGTGADQEDGTA